MRYDMLELFLAFCAQERVTLHGPAGWLVESDEVRSLVQRFNVEHPDAAAQLARKRSTPEQAAYSDKRPGRARDVLEEEALG